jgi:tetratricopeptide (TPR) repeat protein
MMDQFCNKKSVLTVLALFIVLGACGSSVFAQNNRITGRILSPERRPVPQVFVELLNEVNRIVQRTRSDGSGGFLFFNLGTGRYTVKVLTMGTEYEEATQEVQIVSLSIRPGGGSASEDVTIYLNRKKSGDTGGQKAPGVVFAQEVPKEARVAYEKAVSFLSDGKRDQGLTQLLEAVRLFPTYFDALERLAVERLKTGQYAEAYAFYLRAVAVNDKTVNGWYGIAYASCVLGRKGECVNAAEKAAALNPASPDVALLLGIALRQDRQFEKSEKALLAAKKLSDGKAADVYWNLALLYAHDLKNYRLAADALESYLKNRPDYPNATAIRKLIERYRSLGGA